MILPAPDEALWIAVVRLVVEVPGSRSLKDKRRAVHQVRDRLRARSNLSVAEVGHLEDHTRAVLALSMVGNDPRVLRSALDRMLHDVGTWRNVLVASRDVEILQPFDGWQDTRYDPVDD